MLIQHVRALVPALEVLQPSTGALLLQAADRHAAVATQQALPHPSQSQQQQRPAATGPGHTRPLHMASCLPSALLAGAAAPSATSGTAAWQVACRSRHVGRGQAPGAGPSWASSWPHAQAPHAALTPEQRRHMSSEPVRQAQPEDEVAEPLSQDVHYLGPLSNSHKLLKRISVTNTVVAFAAAPAIVHWAENISMVSRYGLAASLVFFGVITTGALHWVAHPYVHELKYHAATKTIDVRTTTLLGNSRWHHFSLDDVQPLAWNRPVATFMAKGQFYYIDVFSFPDPHLLKRLTPDEADVPKGYKDDKDDDDD